MVKIVMENIFEPTFVPCEVGNADWDAIHIETSLTIADWKSV